VPEIEKPRPYSLARAPTCENSGEHTFFIRLVPGGEFSNWLSGADRTGAAVEVTGPLGDFRLDGSDLPIICVAGGSGMSAIHAILEEAAASGVARDCHFLYGARNQRDLYGRTYVDAIRKAWHADHSFEYTEVLSDEGPDTDWSGPRGFVTDHLRESVLEKGVFDVASAHAFLCGPPPMVDAAVGVLSSAGMPAEAMHFDRFEGGHRWNGEVAFPLFDKILKG